jgi:hypothetical protein
MRMRRSRLCKGGRYRLMGEIKITYSNWVENLKKGDSLKKCCVNWRKCCGI